MDFMKNKFMYKNIAVSMIIGGFIYYLMSPEVIFVEKIDSMTGWMFHIGYENKTIKMIRSYVPDILWAYALMFSLVVITGNKTAGIWKMYVVAVLFSTIIEIVQLTGILKGTFDITDVIVELTAELIAVFIIKEHYEEEVT